MRTAPHPRPGAAEALTPPAPESRIPTTSPAVILAGTGGPEVLRVVERPTPAPRADEVLVRVRAAGVAHAQVMMRRGTYPYAPPFPFTPGAEVAGEIAALGPDARGWRVGERVVAFTATGGYAAYAVVPASSLVRLPDAVDADAAAALPMNYVTAHQLLHRAAAVRPGETVLVHGASGGVGTALLQLARLAGVRAVGTASPAKLDVVRALGARALDYTRGDVAARVRALVGPVDVALDPMGGDHVLESRAALRPDGRLVVYGFQAPGADTAGALATLRRRLDAWAAEPGGVRAQLYSLGAEYRAHPGVVRDDLGQMVGLLAVGHIAPVIGARLPLAEVRHAHERLEAGRDAGKLVLVP